MYYPASSMKFHAIPAKLREVELFSSERQDLRQNWVSPAARSTASPNIDYAPPRIGIVYCIDVVRPFRVQEECEELVRNIFLWQ